ncbi:uncharacterized protein [Ambystoma mexicanum]|uniref:uncharacterized protein n=1 Tax=Ambystoma mexicanum TaxID=8296 RepID=UPI0037E7489D
MILPRINGRRTHWLAFADDIVLLDGSAIGLQRLLLKLREYAKLNGLIINPSKSKILIFKHPRKNLPSRIWTLDGKEIPGVDELTYLGYEIFASPTLSKVISVILGKTSKIMAQMKNLKGKFCKFSISPLVKFYIGKAIPVLLYGLEAKPLLWNYEWNKIEGHLWKSALHLPLCTPFTSLRFELGLISLGCRADWKLLSLYCDIITARVTTLYFDVNEQRKKAKSKQLLSLEGKVEDILLRLNLTTEILIHNPSKVKKQLKMCDWIRAIEGVRILNPPNLFLKAERKVGTLPRYLQKFPDQNIRNNFLRIRLNLAHTGEILVQRNQGDIATKLCRSCDPPNLQSLRHLLLECEGTWITRLQLLGRFVSREEGLTQDSFWDRLISGQEVMLTMAIIKVLEKCSIIENYS